MSEIKIVERGMSDTEFARMNAGFGVEARVALLGVVHFFVATAGYEAPGFYQKQGYRIVFEQENYYATGHSRVMLWKTGPAECS